MITLFILICYTSLLVLGYTIASQPDMLLYSVREWAENKNKKWMEPLLICHWCMPSVWSILGYVLSYLTGLVVINGDAIIMYPLVVCGSSIVCGFTWALYLYISEKTSYFISLNNKENEKRDSD